MGTFVELASMIAIGEEHFHTILMVNGPLVVFMECDAAERL